MAPYLMALLLAVPAFAQDDDGSFLERTLEDALSGEGRDVTIRGFEGALSSNASVDSITFSDADGIWLRIADAELIWNRTALLRGRLSVERLTAAEIEIARAPLPANETPSPEATGFSLPDLPVSVSIGEVSAERVVLGEALMGVPAEVSLDGTLSLAGGEGEGSLTAQRLDAVGRFAVSGAFSNATEILDLALDVEEAQGGLLSTLAGLPGAPALDVDVTGNGPLSDFSADLTLATNGESRVTGRLEIVETEPQVTGFRLGLDGDVAPLVLPDYQAFFGDDISLNLRGARRADGSVEVETLNLTAAQLDLDGSATLGADGLPDMIDVAGRIASETGDAVLLPGGVALEGAELNIRFDAALGDDWLGEVVVAGLAADGFTAETLRLDGQGQIDGSVTPTVEAAFDLSAISLDLGNHDAEAALGEDVTGRVEIDWQQGADIELRSFTLAGETYALTGSATIRTEDGLELYAETAGTVQDLSVFSGLAQRPLGGTVTGRFALDAEPANALYRADLAVRGDDLAIGIDEVDQLLQGGASIDAAFRRDETGTFLDSFTAQSSGVEASGSVELTSEGGQAEATVRLTDTSVIAPNVAGPLEVDLSAQGPLDLWDVKLLVDGPGTVLDADGTLDLQGDVPAWNGSLTSKIDTLSPYAPRLGRPVSGGIALEMQGSLLTDLSAFDLEADLVGQDLVIGQDQVDQMLAGETKTQLGASRAGSGIDLRGFAFRSAMLEADIAGDLTVGPSLSDLQGGSGTASVTLLTDALVPGLPVPATIGVIGDGTTELFDLNLNVTGDGLQVDGIGKVDLAGAGAEGQASVVAESLSPFSDLAGRPLGGAVSAELAGSALFDLSVFDISLALSSRDLTIGQTQADQILRGPVTAELEARRTDTQINLQNLFFRSDMLEANGSGQAAFGESFTDLEDASATAKVTLLTDTLLPGLPVPATVEVTGNGAADVFDLAVDVTGEGLAAKAEAQVDIAAERVDGQGDISVGNLEPFAELASLPLRGSVQADFDGGTSLDLSQVALKLNATSQNLGIGQVDVDALISGAGTWSLQAMRDGEVIRLERLEAETPALRVTGSGTTGLEANDATFDLRLANLGHFVPGLNGPATARGTARQTGDDDWQLDVKATAPGNTQAQITGTAAPDFQTLNLGATGRLPLQAANRFIAPRAVTGGATFALRVNGPPALDSVSGQIEAPRARFTSPEQGLTLAGIAARVDLANSSASIDVGGRLTTGGRVSASGPIRLTAPHPADLTVALQNAVLTDPGLYRTSVNGEIGINGNLTGGARIAGTLNLGETEVQIPSSTSFGTAPDFEITHVGEPADVRLTRERAGFIADATSSTGTSARYPLALSINAPNQIFLRGRGLEAELGGQIRLRGTTANVIPEGQFELIRGRLDLLGQRFAFDEGIATLQGDFNPFIRLVAATEQDETVIRVVVEGQATSPDVSFESLPELPEDEVLARLLFGRSAETLSPLQAAQLASAVATLAGRGGGGVVNKLRENFGLDDLDVTSSEEGGTAVRAGAYLSDNVYSDVTVDDAGEAEVNINLDLTPSVTVRGSVDSEGSTGLGIFFERDY